MPRHSVDTSHSVDTRDFWNEKILTWEDDRYAGGKSGLLEKFANRFSGLPQRLANAGTILLPRVAGKHVVELGCGSGLLAEDVIGAGAASYQGFDISDEAMRRAQERADAAGFEGRIRFAAGDVKELGDLESDIVFSLGLLDWLTADQLDAVFKIGAGRDFLHSFSERQMSFWRLAHKAYVWLAYGRKTGAYVPSYHDVDELVEIARRYTDKDIRPFRDPRMRFGCFLTTLPT